MSRWIYFTYTDARPISFNPFYTDDYVFDVEKRESICTLLLTLWKSANEPVFVFAKWLIWSMTQKAMANVPATHVS